MTADPSPDGILRRLARWAALIATTILLAVVLGRVGAPAAILLGPLLAGLVFGVRGVSVRPHRAIFAGAQALIGCMIAMAMTPALLAGLIAHIGLFLLMAVVTLTLSMGTGWLMTVRGWMLGTTAIWGMAPGASTAMVLMSDAFGADRRLVAVMQYVRILIVALLALAFAHAAGAGAPTAARAWFAPISTPDVVATLAVAVVGGFLGLRSRLPAGVFLVPMLGGAALQLLGVVRLDLPPLLLAGAYAVVGWNIGLAFTPQTLRYSARALPRILSAHALVLAGCGLVALLVGGWVGRDPLSAYLATSPGGTDSILIIATSTEVDLPFILGAQLTRFLLVLGVGPLLAQSLAKTLGARTTPSPLQENPRL